MENFGSQDQRGHSFEVVGSFEETELQLSFLLESAFVHGGFHRFPVADSVAFRCEVALQFDENIGLDGWLMVGWVDLTLMSHWRDTLRSIILFGLALIPRSICTRK